MKACNIYVKGKLPFLVLLEDSINEKGIPIDEKVIDLISNDGDLGVGLFFQQKINNNQNGVIIAIEDLYGEFTYSEFIMIYQYHATKNNSLEEFFFKYKNWDFEAIAIYTTELLNKFIEIYKEVTNYEKDWIPFLTHFRISPLSIHIDYDKSERIDGIEILDYRGTGTCLGSTLNNDQLNRLKQLSKMIEVKLDPAFKFIQESNRYYLTGDYISSILFLTFYLEKWIFREVKRKLLKNGKTEQEIYQSFINQKGHYIDRYDAIKLVTNNKNFKNLNEFKEFQKNVIDIRDEIVHRDRVFVGKKMASNANKATMDLRDILFKQIWDK